MSEWETLNCHYHPERIALERCEVCGKPLCAYCLFYTEDGQRLCTDHAEQAREMGIVVDEPGAYADQLIGAQIGAVRKRKRDEHAEDDTLYKGNSTDLAGFIGMLLGLIGIGSCCGAIYCLPLVGVGLSVVALLNANKAHDKSRTRRLGWIGLLSSGVLVLAIVGCIAFYVLSFSTVMTTLPYNWYTPPATYYSPSPTPGPSPTPTLALPEALSSADGVPEVVPDSVPDESRDDESAQDRPVAGYFAPFWAGAR